MGIVATPAAAAAATIALTVLAVGAPIAAGIARSDALKSQAKAAEFEAKISRLRGKQISGQKRVELNRVIAAIDTIRSTRGVGIDSPTGQAIRGATRREAKFARNAAVLTETLNAVRAQTAAEGFRAAAPFAVISGFAQSASTLSSALG